MEVFLSILIIIISILLGAVVLIQNPKGGGLATGFTGVNQIGGVQRTTNFLEKMTWSLAIIIFVLCIWSTAQMPSANEVNIPQDETIPTEVEEFGTDAAPLQ